MMKKFRLKAYGVLWGKKKIFSMFPERKGDTVYQLKNI